MLVLHQPWNPWLAEALGMHPLVAHCHLGLGTLAAAIGLYRAMDMTFWLPQAEAALAQVGGVPPHAALAREVALPSTALRG